VQLLQALSRRDFLLNRALLSARQLRVLSHILINSYERMMAPNCPSSDLFLIKAADFQLQQQVDEEF